MAAGASCSCCRPSSLLGLLTCYNWMVVTTMVLCTSTRSSTGLYHVAVSATSFMVVNHCRNTLDVQVRENAGGPSIGTTGFSLAPGASKSLSPPDGWSGNFGTGTPSLLAEFTIDKPVGSDFYDVSAVDGFMLNVGLSISGNGASVSCSAAASICPSEDVRGSRCVSPNRDDPNTSYVKNVDASCPDAYSWSKDNNAVRKTPTGGRFTITFCP